MASVSVQKVGGARIGGQLLACVAEQGSVAHPYFACDALLRGPDVARNLADAVHALCALHALHPGLLDLAGGRIADPDGIAWLDKAVTAFAIERAYLAQLAAAVGPIPGTPGGGRGEAAVQAQRAALATLASSERRGCAFGAAIALCADWAPVRSVLDFAARRFGVAIPPFGLGRPADLRLIADAAGTGPAIERALMFGAEQLALQHRGLWDLLEARHQARLGG
jgi:hypothetical protein